MDLFKDAEQLREIPLFARLEPTRLELLAFSSEEASFDDGDIIFTMNSSSDSAYVSMSGQAEVFLRKEATGEPIAVLPANDLVGEMGVIGNQPRVATLRAKGQVRCLRILADDFLDLLKDNPEVSLSVLRQLVDRLTKSSQALEAMRSSMPAVSDSPTP